MALFQKQDSCFSSKAATACGCPAESLRSPTRLRSRGGRSAEINVRLEPPTMCRLTPELIALYNEHKITGGGFLAPMAVASMEEAMRPANCISCRSCEKVCPQQIKISEAMKEFSGMIGM